MDFPDEDPDWARVSAGLGSGGCEGWRVEAGKRKRPRAVPDREASFSAPVPVLVALAILDN